MLLEMVTGSSIRVYYQSGQEEAGSVGIKV
jgi:hypothetical protein